jgi:hypothetical protein
MVELELPSEGVLEVGLAVKDRPPLGKPFERSLDDAAVMALRGGSSS